MRAREFIIKEDEYDQFDWPKDPNLLKVNADQTGITGVTTGMSPKEFAMWADRATKLNLRVKRIYARILTVMPPEDKLAMSGVKIFVPFEGEYSIGLAVFDDKIIRIDVGCFWDLSDDCLAYVIGHEIGHMVWAFGPKKNWSKLRGVKRTPAQRRQEEYDADVYGALLAHELGYDRRKAFDQFTIAEHREPFDPSYPNYPSVTQRKSNIDKALAQKKQEKNAAQQSTQPLVPEPSPAPQEPTTPSPEKVEKDAWLHHIMNGMQKFEVALSQDPNINLT
jgi:hypothetical protein